ncbi:MAG: hypothetical protein IPP78_15945 [Holophagaceae bacterium]|nr:hypothetical protein [Holophagaceae bacterium]
MDPILAAEIVETLELQLADNVKGRMLGPDGQVLRRGLNPNEPYIRSQLRAYEYGYMRSGAGALTQKLAELRPGDLGF